MVVTALHYDISIPYEYMSETLCYEVQPGFCSVVVITCASHAQGPQFNPEQKQIYFRSDQIFYGIFPIEILLVEYFCYTLKTI